MHRTSKTPFGLIHFSRAGALAFFCFAFYFLGEAFFGHGSRPGNILRVEFGAFLLVLGLILLAISTMQWPSPDAIENR